MLAQNPDFERKAKLEMAKSAQQYIADNEYYLYAWPTLNIPKNYKYNFEKYLSMMGRLEDSVCQKYGFSYRPITTGCIVDPTIYSGADTFNHIMKNALVKRNGFDWYERYKRDSADILAQNRLVLDSLAHHFEELDSLAVPFGYKVSTEMLEQFYVPIARFMLDHPTTGVEIICYPPKNNQTGISSIENYQKMVAIIINNFGIDRSRFRYKAILNDVQYENKVRVIAFFPQ